jgi:hypothetical protein
LIDDIRNYSSKFSTSKYKAFENKLVTSNQSEGFNFVIKSMTEWTQIKPDVIVLILHYLQNYYLYEFGRAVKNLGNYHFSNFLPKNYEMKEISDVVHFKDIINKVRGQIDVKSQAQQNKDRLSVVAMARFALENNYISVNEKLGCFTMRSHRSDKKFYIIQLSPKPTCTCTTKSTCYHIISCQMMVGIYNPNNKSDINLSHLVEEHENFKSTKSGKKHFRKIDLKPINESLSKNSEKFAPISDSSNEETYLSSNSIFNDDNSGKSQEVYIIGEKYTSTENFLEKLAELKAKVNKILTRNEERVRRRNLRRNIYPDLKIELCEWENFIFEEKIFEEDFESLNPGIWLRSDILENAITALINKFDLNEVVGILGINCLKFIVGNNFERCLR